MPLYLIPLFLGFVLARYYLGRDNWPALIAQTGGLALVTTLIGVNGFYHITTLQNSLLITLTIQSILGGLLWWKRPAIPVAKPLGKYQTFFLLALTAVVLFYTNSQQIAALDDDFWIHTALQGLVRNGTFPLRNPFFPDIPMNGHYGRNLTIVWLGELGGMDNFIVQHFFTTTTQVLSLLLFFSGFSRSSGSRTAGLIAALCVFFGVNGGGHCGLADTYQNNNSFAYFYMAIIFDLSMDLWQKSTKTSVVLTGLCLGSYAIVYESHFGICFLAILGVTPILLARGVLSKKQALMSLLALVVSLPLAFTQGGPLTEIVQRKINPPQHRSDKHLSKGMQNQSQVVKIKFPKKNFLQIHLETGDWQRIAAVYTLESPLDFINTPATDRGYAYIWSWKVLRIHFLPLYLLPFSFIVLWKRKSLAGLWTGAFGVISFLVPAVVDFGPVYESEYYRWEFAAAVGFAGSLGLALFHSLPGKLSEMGLPRRSGTKVIFPKAYFKTALIFAVLALNCWACTHFVSKRFAEALKLGPSGWLYFPPSEEWLVRQPALRFEEIDFRMATWLNTVIKPGDRLFTNFSDENSFSILQESAITGVSGARCVGHALPLDVEKIGTTPFRMSPPANLFWKTYRPEPLKQLQAEWLLYSSNFGEQPPDIPAATEAHRITDGDKIRVLFRIDQSQLEDFARPPEQRSDLTYQGRFESDNWELRSGELFHCRVKVWGLRNAPKPETGTKIRGTLTFSTVRLSDELQSHPQEDIKLQVDTEIGDNGEAHFELPFIAPYEEGEYHLKAVWHPADKGPNIEFETAVFQNRFSQLLGDISVSSLDIQDPSWLEGTTFQPRKLLYPQARLAIPDEIEQGQEVLACWAFYSEEEQKFDIRPETNYRTIKLTSRIDQLPFVTPEKPGSYRLSLYISPIQGQLIRIPSDVQITVAAKGVES